MSRISKAITFMKAAHRSIGQTRKDGIRPYEVHPLEVMARVAAVENNEDILIAALLHDVIEDVYPVNDSFDIYSIANNFGDFAAKLVVELTDCYTKEAHPDKNRRTRKELERARYGMISANAKLIKLADITTNLLDDGDVTNEGSFGGPDVGFNVMYIKEKEQCLPFLHQPSDRANEALYKDAIDALKSQAAKFNVRLTNSF